jgi:ATP synthase F1 gamma subunit
MPSLKVIRKRIASTKATQKITRAMKMVAGARLTRAQQRIVSMRPYAVKTAEVLESVARTMVESQNEPVHPLLARRPEKKALILVFSADRGLCGALNTNVNKATERTWREKQSAGVDVAFATLGRKGREYLGRREANVVQDFQRIYEGLDVGKAQLVARWIIQRFEKGEFDAVYLVFNEFKSAIAQKLTIERLLPLGDPPAKAAEASRAGGTRPERLKLRAARACGARTTRPDVRRDHDLPRPAREPGELLRRADDGHGCRHPQREGHDRAVDARLQSRASGRDHQRAHGDHRRRRSTQGMSGSAPERLTDRTSEA